MRVPFAALALASWLFFAGSVGHADADTVPPEILLGAPPPSACAFHHVEGSDEQLACTLLRSHPAVLCFAAKASLGCPTPENLRACPEFAQLGPQTPSADRRDATQCTLRRPGPHFFDPTALSPG